MKHGVPVAGGFLYDTDSPIPTLVLAMCVAPVYLATWSVLHLHRWCYINHLPVVYVAVYLLIWKNALLYI